jgi:HK97 family phage major capsid protein
MDPVLAAIEKSNNAFQEYKNAQEARFEALEAKQKRPGFKAGGDDNPAVRTAVRREVKSDEEKAIERWMRTLDTTELKAMSIGSGPDGGITVPKVIDDNIESQLKSMSPLRPWCRVVQVSTSDWHTLVSLRGLGAAWVSETAARPVTASSQFVDVKPPIGELYANVSCTQILLDDSQFDLTSWLAEELAYQFSSTESDAFLNGTGSSANQPLGILQSTFVATADGTRADRSLQYVPSGVAGGLVVPTATASPVDALINLIGAMRVGYRAGSCWVMNPLTFAALMQVKDLQGRVIVTPSLIAGQPDQLLGFPVVLCDGMPNIAAGNIPILFGNFRRGYVIVDRIGLRLLPDPYSSKPNVLFYATKRVGGMILNSEAIKGLKISVS